MSEVALHGLLRELGEGRFDGLGALSRGILRTGRLRRRERLTVAKIREAHRWETAHLLFRAAQTRRQLDPYWAGLISNELPNGERMSLATPQEIRRDTENLVRSGALPMGGAGSIVRDLLALQPRTSTKELITASLALVRTAGAGMLLSAEHIRRNRLSQARLALDQAFERLSSSLSTSIAWEHAGAIELRSGRLDRAFEAYRTASRVEPGRAFPLACAFLIAILARDRARALRAGEELEETGEARRIGIDSAALAFQELRRRGMLPDSPPSRELEGFRGPITTRLAHVLEI